MEDEKDTSELTKMSAIRKRVQASQAYWKPIYSRVKTDLKMANGVADSQWSQQDKDIRGANRAQVSLPMLDKYVERMVGNYNSSPFGITLTPKSNDQMVSAKAKVLSAVIQGIESRSDAKTVYRQALRSSGTGGYGWFYLTSDYSDPAGESLEVEVRLEGVVNPMSVVLDELSVKIDGSDAEHATHIDYIPINKAVELYGEDVRQSVSHDSDFFDQASFKRDNTDDVCPVITHWCKKYSSRTIYFNQDGTKADKLIEGGRSRSVQSCTVICTKIVGNCIVSEIDMKIPYLPIIPVYGLPVLIADGIQYVGLIHRSIDAQKALNYSASLGMERLALSPKANYIGASEAIASSAEAWKNSARSNPPILTYDAYTPDGKPLPPPMKQDTSVNLGDVITMQQAYENTIASTIGMPIEGIGGEGNRQETAEAALLRARASETILSTLYENLATSIIHAGRVALHMLSANYDTAREVPVKVDGKMTIENIDFAKLNIVPSEMEVTIDAGPLLSTQRKENLRSYLALAQIAPPQFQAALYPKVVECIDDADPEFIQQIQQIGQMALQQQAQGMQDAQAMGQENQQLKSQLQQAQQGVILLQQRMRDTEIKARTDMAKAQLDAQTKIAIEQMKQQGASQAQLAQAAIDAQLQMDKMQAELEKELATSDPILPAGLAPTTYLR